MKRVLFILFVLLTHLAICPAQLLYEISGNGALGKSYLLATNRLTDKTFIDTIPGVFAAYSRCHQQLTEFCVRDYEAIATLRQAALLADSVRLSNFYSDDDYRAIDEALRITLNMSLDQLSRMKPSYLTELYRTELLKRWLNYDEQNSMEHFFEAVSQSQQMPVIGLDQLGEAMYMLFDREPFPWQCQQLKNIIDYPEREIRQERSIAQMYRAGRLTDIAYLVEGPDNLSTISYSDYQVYAQRNRTWAKRLVPYLKQGGCFITLDAVYLGGDKGLIANLKEAGYRVHPVKH